MLHSPSCDFQLTCLDCLVMHTGVREIQPRSLIATDVDVLLNKHGCFSGKSDLSAAFGKNFKKGALGEETQYISCIEKVGTRRSIVL